MNVHFLVSTRLLVRYSLSLAALLVLVSCSTNSAHAQGNGYDFGVGWGWAQQPLRLSTPREDLPYFAKFPPVYYGDMVRRPYGFSPYALPPGIEPIEQRVLQQTTGARTILNPFCEPTRSRSISPVAPAGEPAPPKVEAQAPAADTAPSLPDVEDSDVAARRA
ncbi:MAG: hypothetical protein Q8M16_13105 [Pirellulaceae bacterium]|nr:hypothetical protein [Pirellulaceae bacterium]